MKKGIFLLSIIILLVAGWSGGWFFISNKVEAVISDTKAKLAEKNRHFECTDQQTNGFPFRISLNCDEIRYTDEKTGFVFKAGKLKTAAQAYQPNKAIVELTSPAYLTLENGDQFDTTWKSMRSSLITGLSGPQNIALQGKDVIIVPLEHMQHTVLIKDMQFHARQVGDNDINLAVNLGEAKSQNLLWPTFNFGTVLLLKDNYKDVIRRTSLIHVAKTKGLKGQIESFQYAPDEGGVLKITGPLEVSTEGKLSGRFDVSVQDLPKLLNSLGKSFPKEQKKFNDASAAVSLLAKKSASGEINLPIEIKNGRINIGIIPLGKIPPLF